MRLSLIAATAFVGLFSITGANAAHLTDQPLVDSAWLSQHLNDEGMVILDLRDASKKADPYAAGHIPGAVAAPYGAYGWRTTVDGVPGMLPPLDDIGAKIAALGIDNDTEVVLMPAGSDASEFGDATRVYWTFKVLGHQDVTILNGGWHAWQQAKGAVSTEAVTPVKGNFTPKLTPEVSAQIDEVKQAIKSNTDLVDARSVAQFIGKQKTNTVQEYGTIPTAVNIEFNKFWNDDTHTFATKDQVEALAKAGGLLSQPEIITFCNTGHLASIAWFALSEVGGLKNVKMFDGSMSQWTSDPANPVVLPKA
jgi:thiosulfate/3-mercaptopyruvate sulfurtransferase